MSVTIRGQGDVSLTRHQRYNRSEKGRARAARWRANNLEKSRKATARWSANNPEKRREADNRRQFKPERVASQRLNQNNLNLRKRLKEAGLL